MINDYKLSLVNFALELRNMCFRNIFFNLNLVNELNNDFKDFIEQLLEFPLTKEDYQFVSRSLKELIIYADNGGDALDIFNYCKNVLLKKRNNLRVHPLRS